MTVNVHNPRELEYAPIGETLARHVTIPELSELILARFSDEGIEDLVVSPESQNLGAGCGSFAAGAATAGEIPITWEEIVVILDGSLTLTCNGVTQTASAGEFVYITAGSDVHFSTNDGCLLVYVTCPPVWKSFEEAFKAGKLT